MESPSEIAEFYKGRSIFVTGGSGFMGKVLVEKLLRSCSGLRRIYLLVRTKKGKNMDERFDDLLKSRVFDRVKEEQPNFRDKLAAISGELTKDKLGISESDLALLASEVSVVFHVAATVRLHEELRTAIEVNILGTLRAVEVCRELPKLKALVHVSTAYCNTEKVETEEIIYPCAVEPHDLIDALKWMDKDMFETIAPKLLGKLPNTYSFTKKLAEKLLVKERGDLPVAIIRPTIVTAAWKEPFPGWIDGLNGPSIIVTQIAKGVIRSMLCYTEKVVDVIPADISISMAIAIAWYTEKYRPLDTIIYTCGTSTLTPVSWKVMFDGLNGSIYNYPSNEVFRYPGGRFKRSQLLHKIAVALENYIPAAFIDALLLATGKKPRVVSLYKRVDKRMEVFNYYTTQEWFFRSKNQFLIWDRMSKEDKKVFNFDVKSVNWDKYWDDFVLGIRQYIFKEDPATIPSAREKIRNLYIRNVAINIVLGAGVAYFFASVLFDASFYEYLFSPIA